MIYIPDAGDFFNSPTVSKKHGYKAKICNEGNKKAAARDGNDTYP
jgi:hypothetical protein